MNIICSYARLKTILVTVMAIALMKHVFLHQETFPTDTALVMTSTKNTIPEIERDLEVREISLDSLKANMENILRDNSKDTMSYKSNVPSRSKGKIKLDNSIKVSILSKPNIQNEQEGDSMESISSKLKVQHELSDNILDSNLSRPNVPNVLNESSANFVSTNTIHQNKLREISINSVSFTPYVKISYPKVDERKLEINRGLKRMGLESIDLHDFKSVYIRDPVIYSKNLTPKIPGIRKTIVISCFRCFSFFKLSALYRYNRDFKQCPYSECHFDERGVMQKEADVVLFFHTPKPMPYRPEGQIWIYTSWEPQGKIIKKETETKTQIKRNATRSGWSIGYGMFHTFFMPFRILAWRDQETMLPDNQYIALAKSKPKLAAWVVSHCHTRGKRERYVEEMQKIINVDIYGKCGNLTCSKTMCLPILNDTYKFYLAFENSFCTDYVSEKFFKTFEKRVFVIPVVRGGIDYDRYFPPNTFIDTKNFKSPRELALYLKELGDDVPRYAKMLKAKDRLTTLSYLYDWCEFCKVLHTKTNPQPKSMLSPQCWYKKGV